ncbi:MAG: iron ABC transporter permease [Planctomycetes bacterium]|nr:iron ABC transporter permease [Planctomycetota bacterium]
MNPSPRRSRIFAASFVVLLVVLFFASTCIGPTVRFAPADAWRGILAMLGLGKPLDVATVQTILELRVWRALVTIGVGASLALSGGFIQGLFQNGLASPSLIGVTGGASLGAAVAVLIVGGYAPRLVLEHIDAGAYLIPLFGFIGAFATTAIVVYLASGGGRTSVTALLLTGIAVNMCVAGLFAALQSLTLANWEVSRAILAWTFGTLDDRTGYHAGVVFTGLALALACIPFTAVELDLLKGGESDAAAVGVDVARLKWTAIFAAAVSASAAVAVAGQIAFVGLVVPHLVRLAIGASHRVLLPLSVLGGAVFLLGAEFVQRWLLGDAALQPGVVMSLIGGPFFLVLLVRERREISAW